MNSKNYKNTIGHINNLDIIEWAFEKGYYLARDDIKESIHIDFSETQNYFLEELIEYCNKKNNKYMSASTLLNTGIKCNQ